MRRLPILKEAPFLQRRLGEPIDVLIRDIPQRSHQSRAPGLHVVHGRAVRLVHARFGHCSATATHEQRYGALVESFDGPRADILAAAAVAEIEVYVSGFEGHFQFGFFGFAVYDGLPVRKLA